MEITLPEANAGVGQDEEWCEVGANGSVRRIRFHDYDEIYSIPGLYERLFYEVLQCQSPGVVCGLLEEQLGGERERPHGLRILEVGAGNGMVGEELVRRGAELLVGVDIIEEAAMAAERDRPGTYDDYKVLDLCAMSDEVKAELAGRRFNCLVTVAALGFGDIPPLAFAEAYNLVADGGWIAFNIKETFIDNGERSGFSILIDEMVEGGKLEPCAKERYQHRLSAAGEPIHYVAVVARKLGDVPLSSEWVRAAGAR